MSVRLAPLRAPTGSLALCTAAIGVAAGLGLAAAAIAGRAAPAADPCALPPGIDVASLPDADRSLALRRGLLCEDLEHGRLTLDEYRTRLDPRPTVLPLGEQWASSVIAASSQYSEASWAAQRALGVPDVFPAGGDLANAWASRGADDAPEYLELGYAMPTRISAVDLFETYNPGAVTRIEAVTVSGRHLTIYEARPEAIAQPSFHRHLDLACTDEPIASVRIEVDSQAVPGWNEIDAVGVVPCE